MASIPIMNSQDIFPVRLVLRPNAVCATLAVAHPAHPTRLAPRACTARSVDGDAHAVRMWALRDSLRSSALGRAGALSQRARAALIVSGERGPMFAPAIPTAIRYLHLPFRFLLGPLGRLSREPMMGASALLVARWPFFPARTRRPARLARLRSAARHARTRTHRAGTPPRAPPRALHCAQPAEWLGRRAHTYRCFSEGSPCRAPWRRVPFRSLLLLLLPTSAPSATSTPSER